MDKTTDHTEYLKGSNIPGDYPSTPPDDYPSKQKSWNVPITMPTPNNSSYFLEVEGTYGAKFFVHECVGFICIEKRQFDTLKEAVTFIKEKGGIK